MPGPHPQFITEWEMEYGVRQLNEQTGIVEKCMLCFSRLDEGLVPRCVETCQLQARAVGDADDSDSEIVKQIRKK